MNAIDNNPQIAAVQILMVAPTDELLQFVGNAITTYFKRILRASYGRLVAFGLRPVMAPVAAEQALQRVQHIDYSPAWIHALIANDAEAARLAIRAVRFYSDRYVAMPLDGVTREVGDDAVRVKDAARFLSVAFQMSSN